MTEQLVSFELAKLAKEKGFNDFSKNPDNIPTHITQSLLQRWLREKYFREVIVLPTNNNKYFFINIYRAMQCDLNEIERAIEVINSNILHVKYYNSYEEALEAGLIKTLKSM